MSRNLLDSIKLLKSTLSKSEHLVFLTGAGISKESGIPTFRGYEGLWMENVRSHETCLCFSFY
jgi:NAD-dependent SIR2 family protein deacetylase